MMADLEDRTRPRGGLHDRAEARRADAALRAAPGRAGAGGRAAAGRPERPHRRRRDRAPRSSSIPDVDKIAFTGSTAVGREIGAKAGQALKRVTLELGGKSPNIILPDADIDAAIKGAFQGIYFNSGQACNAGSRLFVPEERFDEVVGRARRARHRDASRAGSRPRDPARPARLRRAAAARHGLHRVRARAGGRAAGRRRRPRSPTAAATSSRRRCSPSPTTT